MCPGLNWPIMGMYRFSMADQEELHVLSLPPVMDSCGGRGRIGLHEGKGGEVQGVTARKKPATFSLLASRTISPHFLM